jgi:hypothetical protein
VTNTLSDVATPNPTVLNEAMAQLKQGGVRVDEVNARIQALTH